MRRSSRGSAGEESDEEWVEEQIERDESTESLDELGLPLSSSKSSSSPRPSSSHHFDPANLIVLDFGPAPKGGCHRPRRYVKYGLFLCFFFSNCFITESNVVELELFLKFEIKFSCLMSFGDGSISKPEILFSTFLFQAVSLSAPCLQSGRKTVTPS